MLMDLVRASRSFRSFDRQRPVSREELLELIAPARLCPSAGNRQFLRYAPVTEPAEAERVLACTKWAGALPDRHFPPSGHEPPAYIVICHDTAVSENVGASAHDVGIAAQTILLGAAERGLGGCMIGSFRREGIAEALSLPPRYVPVLVIALGHPDETVVLEDAPDGAVTYYRDAANVHHVPKRTMAELVIR